jgi:TatD DNase family protein
MFVDSHCHLSFPELYSRIDPIRADMAAAQVDRALVICTQMTEFAQVHSLATRWDNFWATVGVHPDTEPDEHEPDVADLVRLAALDRVVAIGETGLDYFRLNGRSIADMQWQRDRFAVHIHAARQTRMPLVIHTREASADTLAILRSEGGGEVGGVFHCFTETDLVAAAALDLGFLISFSGIITFKNAEALRDVVRQVPLEQCLIETDSPYLAPVPYRGKLNSPAYVPRVAAQIAAIKGCDIATVARVTSANFERLFGIPSAAAVVSAASHETALAS